MNAFTSFLIADSGTAVGWTITSVLTLVLIGLPTLYLLVLILGDDENGFDRRVSAAGQHVKLSERAQARSGVESPEGGPDSVALSLRDESVVDDPGRTVIHPRS